MSIFNPLEANRSQRDENRLSFQTFVASQSNFLFEKQFNCSESIFFHQRQELFEKALNFIPSYKQFNLIRKSPLRATFKIFFLTRTKLGE